ncbi:MAG: AAA family ATPase [Stellaceae bacterium]
MIAADQEAVIEFLSAGAAYGRPGAEVARIDTHASVVFLVADRAFKMKRQVRYSYLDYSTVERREAMCRAELDLNRRTAPELYLGLHAVTREGDGRLALDGAGAAVDWLIEMKRFDQTMLFDHLAERHALTARMMRDLADAIAQFHDAAEPCDCGAYGAALTRIAEESLANLAGTGDELDQAKVAALSTATRTILEKHRPALDARGAAGHVRRCHGDLHLRNICLWDGKPTLFDGIEFNDAFTRIDTAYDLAFLLMDLNHRGLHDLATIVSNRYFDRGGDDDALALLPLYLSLRAGVRAHVSIAAEAGQQDAAAKRALGTEAASYLDQALALLRPAAPRLIAVGGLSGSGKSTIAMRLAPQFAPAPGARVLRTDMIRKRLFGVAPETRLPESAYDLATNRRVYDALYRRAGDCLGAGYSVIADAAFLDPAERDAIAAVADGTQVPFVGLWLDVPPALLEQRLAARRGDASDADRRVLQFQLGRDLGPLAWHRVNADGNPDAVAASARRTVADIKA